MRKLFRRLFGQDPAPRLDESRGPDEDFSWMFPPNTMVDSGAWDRFWQDQVSFGVAGFVDLFVDDGELVDAMRASGLRTVLCVGNGISSESRALAWAGFDVTSLDISPLAAKLASEAAPPDEVLVRLVGGRPGGLGGKLVFVVGDLLDPACCQGPYDVVIDRKTLQLWPDGGRSEAIRAVANRLASRGIFFSQSHDGGWRPPAPPQHALQRSLLALGWDFWQRDSPLTGRVAWLFTTTG